MTSGPLAVGLSARKAICSQLEGLENRAIIYNFVL